VIFSDSKLDCIHHLLLRLSSDYNTALLVDCSLKARVAISHELTSSRADLDDDKAGRAEPAAQDIDEDVTRRFIADNDDLSGGHLRFG
jgi:hypothetical protein